MFCVTNIADDTNSQKLTVNAIPPNECSGWKQEKKRATKKQKKDEKNQKKSYH